MWPFDPRRFFKKTPPVEDSDRICFSEPIDTPDFCIDINDKIFDELALTLSGSINMENSEHVRRQIVELIQDHSLKNVCIDMSRVEYLDSSGAAVLMEIHQIVNELGNSLKLDNIPERIDNFLKFTDIKQIEACSGILEPTESVGVIEQIGAGVLEFLSGLKEMITFLGAAIQAFIKDILDFRRLRWDGFWKLVEKNGSDAVPITLILSFLMGWVLAFQAAIQLRKFGANIFVADLVSVSISLEMGPLMTAIIISGRSGAAFAAYIGTMKVNEEIDALRIMGIDPMRYLVSPRVLAIALILPCLTILADLLGIIGGCFASVFALDLTPVAYFNQVHKVLEVQDIVKGLIKSFVFGVQIALVGCFRGFQVRGGAESVGNVTTSAVVTSIFVLTITDAVFAVIYHYVDVFWK
jgi:phospholipid/cholesterol/gamma-HCH transport system permease protein